MPALSAKARIALGQTGLLVSLMLTAALLGLIPDRQSAVRDARAALAEVLATHASMLVADSRPDRAEAMMTIAVERNPDLQSVALRKGDGSLAVAVGGHAAGWQPMTGQFSTPTQVRVPIMDGARQWGQLELRFQALRAEGWLAYVDNAWLKLIGYVGLLAFVAFYIYLGKMLKQLDPAQAVPGRVRSALDTMAEGLLVLDGRENVVLANLAFASLVGAEPDALIGRRAGTFEWRDEDGQALPADALPWRGTVATGGALRDQMLRLVVADGTTHTFMVNCSPVLGGGGGGRAGGVLVSFDDVTALEAKEVELRKSKAEAEEANESKSAFLANMSHEIRTPMNAILGFTELLKRGYGDDARENIRHLDTIHSSGKHLLDLINDILDLSKVEAGRLEVERAQFSPQNVIHETLKILRVKADEKGISLDFEAHGELPAQIESDPGRLRQIVTNLVGNAIKFTDRGGVTVRASMATNEDGTPRYQIDIIDTGVGMQPEQLERIFDPFSQADSSITRKFGGTGLGLSISKRFAEALGGDVAVVSAPGEGSTFTVTIDVGSLIGVRWLNEAEAAEYLEIAAQNNDDAVWRFPPARVLVVDDGRENRQLVRLVMEDLGLTVAEAENGQVGVDRARAESFDLVLMDVQMPVMDGFEATQLLRAEGYQPPIVALTANAMKGFEAALIEAGFSAYLTKPIDIDVLLRELAGHLGGYQEIVADAQAADGEHTAAKDHDCSGRTPAEAHSDPDRDGRTGEPPGATLPVVPIVSTRSGADPRFAPMVRQFLVELRARLAAGAEPQDAAGHAELGHWARGSGGTMGFDVLTEPCAALEAAAKSGNVAAIDAAFDTLRALTGRLVATAAEAASPSSGNATADAATAAGPSPPAPAAVAMAQAGESPDPEAVAERPAVGVADTPAGDPQPRAAVRSRYADNPRFAPVIEKFLGTLRASQEALEAAWQQRDHARVAEIAHFLRGAAGTVGFDAFTAPSQALEDAVQANDENAVSALVAELVAVARSALGDPGPGIPGAIEAPDADPAATGPAEANLPIDDDNGTARDTGTERPAGGQPLVSTYAGDPRFEPVIGRFLETLPERLVTLDEAWATADLSLLADTTHGLRGAATTVGFEAFGEPCRELETAARAGQLDASKALWRPVRSLICRAMGTSEEEDHSASLSEDERGGDPGATGPVGPVLSKFAEDPRFATAIGRFAATLGARMEELAAALAAADGTRLGDAAHGLRGAAGTVGFDDLVEPCAALERAARGGDLEAAARLLAHLQALGAAVVVNGAPAANAEGGTLARRQSVA